MKEFKGTKGEWFPNVISTITIGVNAEINKTNEGIYSQNVCEFILPDSDEEYEKNRIEIEANAKLIAAAPELLEAVKIALEMCEYKIMPTEDDLNVLAVELRNAINKAL